MQGNQKPFQKHSTANVTTDSYVVCFDIIEINRSNFVMKYISGEKNKS